MSSLTPEDIQNLVTKAFVLEALTDKPGCTTRYEDLPGKPLQDFVIAGINAAPFFGKLAQALRDSPDTPIYTFNPDTLRASNQHKSAKFINFGLIELLIPTVVARLQCDSPEQVISHIPEVLKQTTMADVVKMLEARDIAWATSAGDHKNKFDTTRYNDQPNVWSFYEQLLIDFAPGVSHHDWVVQFQQGLPMVQIFFDAYNHSGEIMQSTSQAFAEVQSKFPDVKIGIPADMCAAAIFLWLSFNDKPV